MFLLRHPGPDRVTEFLAAQKHASLTYEPVGLSAASPSGYNVDEYDARIGRGEEALSRAKAAIDSWASFDIGWVELVAASDRPDVGADVALVVRHFGFWSLNGCRVVRRFPDEPGDPRYGFAYGTLHGHAQTGEESFTVELDPSDGTVLYRIRAVSKPSAILAWLGYPVTRMIQQRFREHSARAMSAAVGRA